MPVSSARSVALGAILVLWATVVIAKEPRVEGDRLDFELPDLNGETVASSDELLEGKVLLVTLWGTWCPPCISEIPTFNDLQARYGAEGLVVVAIAFDRGGEAKERRTKLQKFAAKHEIGYLVLDGGLTSGFSETFPLIRDVKGLPVEILIDRHGMVVDCRHGFGFSEKWAQELEGRVEGLLAEGNVRGANGIKELPEDGGSDAAKPNGDTR